MKVRELSPTDAHLHPEMVWNACVDLLTKEDPFELSAIQRPAQLVFWYERDVQEGGHKQYFQRHGPGSLEPTLEALGLLGAKEQQQILREAAAAQSRWETFVPTKEEQYLEWLGSINLAGLDARFRGCSSSLTKHLETYLNNHLSSFVVVREGSAATDAWKNPWAIYGMMHVVGIPLCYVGMAIASRPIVLAGSALLLPSSLLVPGLLWSVPGEPVPKGGELVFALAFAAFVNLAIFGLYRGLKRISRWGRTSPTGQRLHQVISPRKPPKPAFTLSGLVQDARTVARSVRVPGTLFLVVTSTGLFLSSLAMNVVNSPHWQRVFMDATWILGALGGILFLWMVFAAGLKD